MPELDDKKAFLQALQNVSDKRKEARVKSAFDPVDRSVNLAKGSLDKDILKARGVAGAADITEPVTKLKGTDVINPQHKQPIVSGEDFSKKQKDLSLKRDLSKTFKTAAESGDTAMMSKLRKIAKVMGRGAKSLPVIGSLAALASAEEASAAIPILDMAEPTGPSEGSLGAKLEAGTITPEEREILKKQAMVNLLKSRK